MSRITVKSKVAGFHPVSGNHLVEGESFEIGESEWSGEVFERPEPGWLSPEERISEQTSGVFKAPEVSTTTHEGGE